MGKGNGQFRAVTAGSLNLAETRLKSGRTLEQIADATKISIRFLRAIEAEEFSQLPGGIFSRSYLTQYAGQIGIEASGLIETYRVRIETRQDAA
jgi:cytoskeletal protein RodZ